MLVYDPTAPISKYFKMYEVAKSDIADRNNIDNTPLSPVLEAAQAVATTILDPIREQFGPFSPNSWYRGEMLERFINENAYRTWCIRRGLRVNDSSWSQYFSLKSHPKGEAVDIEIVGIPNDDLFEWIDLNIPMYDQLIREFPRFGDPRSGWVHVSFSRDANRRQKFIIS